MDLKMINGHSSSPRDVLQEYFSLLNDATNSRDANACDIKLLRAWGVFRYILSGPVNCEQCQTPVRLAIPIDSERLTGESLHYDCLCPTCTFKELRLSRCIVMQVGGARVEYPHEDCLS